MTGSVKIYSAIEMDIEIIDMKITHVPDVPDKIAIYTLKIGPYKFSRALFLKKGERDGHQPEDYHVCDNWIFYHNDKRRSTTQYVEAPAYISEVRAAYYAYDELDKKVIEARAQVFENIAISNQGEDS